MNSPPLRSPLSRVAVEAAALFGVLTLTAPVSLAGHGELDTCLNEKDLPRLARMRGPD